MPVSLLVVIIPTIVGGAIAYRYITKKSKFEECLNTLIQRGVDPQVAARICSQETDSLTLDDIVKTLGILAGVYIGYKALNGRKKEED